MKIAHLKLLHDNRSRRSDTCLVMIQSLTCTPGWNCQQSEKAKAGAVDSSQDDNRQNSGPSFSARPEIRQSIPILNGRGRLSVAVRCGRADAPLEEICGLSVVRPRHSPLYY